MRTALVRLTLDGPSCSPSGPGLRPGPIRRGGTARRASASHTLAGTVDGGPAPPVGPAPPAPCASKDRRFPSSGITKTNRQNPPRSPVVPCARGQGARHGARALASLTHQESPGAPTVDLTIGQKSAMGGRAAKRMPTPGEVQSRNEIRTLFRRPIAAIPRKPVLGRSEPHPRAAGWPRPASPRIYTTKGPVTLHGTSVGCVPTPKNPGAPPCPQVGTLQELEPPGSALLAEPAVRPPHRGPSGVFRRTSPLAPQNRGKVRPEFMATVTGPATASKALAVKPAEFLAPENDRQPGCGRGG